MPKRKKILNWFNLGKKLEIISDENNLNQNELEVQLIESSKIKNFQIQKWMIVLLVVLKYL